MVRISEFSTQAEIGIETLRYYDKIGLLQPRKVQGQRIYCAEDLAKAKSILLLKKLNFTLDEIRQILELDRQLEAALAAGDGEAKVSAGSARQMLAEKYVEVLEQERQIAMVKEQLEYLIEKVEGFLGEKIKFTTGEKG